MTHCLTQVANVAFDDRVTGPFRRSLKRALATLLIAVVAVILLGYVGATREPFVRRIALGEPAWPQGVAPISIVLISDLHVQRPDMPPARVGKIVGQINALQPDIVVLAGDYSASHFLTAESYPLEAAVAPLRHLRPRLGVFGVLGNHDREQGEETIAALENVGIKVLENEAVQIGPLSLGGLHTRVRRTVRRLLRKKGTRILVAHSPDIFPRVPPSIPLVLAGHTHCGQIVFPGVGAVATGSRFGSRYLCGIVREQGKMLIVTAGVGTSRMPLRIGAPPDIWLITIGPPRPDQRP